MSKIIFIGDSITKGTDYGGVTTTATFAYKIGIANGYASQDILNKGISSDTSGGVLARLQADVLANAPDVCVLMIGHNDRATGVPVATFKANLQSVAASLGSNGIKLVIMTPPMERGAASLFVAFNPYLKAMEEVAAEYGLACVDQYREFCYAALRAQYLSLYVDAVHLSISGHEYVKEYAMRSKFSGVFTP